jgi:hypothetical protein
MNMNLGTYKVKESNSLITSLIAITATNVYESQFELVKYTLMCEK